VLPKEWRIPRDLCVENIIGKIHKGVSTRRTIANYYRHVDENQKDVINRRNGQGSKHLKFFLLVFAKR